MHLGDYPPIHIREITPKDFYFAQILRSKESSFIPLVYRMVRDKTRVDSIPAREFRVFVNWAIETLLTDSVLTVENWLEVSFHLCKQRWDSSMDWLEIQPMSKIKAMIDVTQKYVEEENDRIKRGS